jgi:SulP family sulfate permease
MLATVAATLATHDLSIGVLIGVVLSAIAFTRKVAKQTHVTSELDAERTHRIYVLHGQLFFVSTQDFVGAFDMSEALTAVTLDLTHAHIWDSSAVGALDTVIMAFMRRGVAVDVIGLNEAGATLVDRIALYDKPHALTQVAHT